MATDPATTFVLMAVQDWGQPDERRIAAVQAVLDAAGFNATATCGPVFGDIWPKECEGTDAGAATAWLRNLTDTMRRGKFEHEVQHVRDAIARRAKATTDAA